MDGNTHLLVMSLRPLCFPRLAESCSQQQKRISWQLLMRHRCAAVGVCPEKAPVSAVAPSERIFPAGDDAFEFQRTASRLIEMLTRNYLAAG